MIFYCELTRRGVAAGSPNPRGMGMQTMPDRAAAIGGRLYISSEEGVEIDYELPNRLTPRRLACGDAFTAVQDLMALAEVSDTAHAPIVTIPAN
jgi:hypothetical protein